MLGNTTGGVFSLYLRTTPSRSTSSAACRVYKVSSLLTEQPIQTHGPYAYGMGPVDDEGYGRCPPCGCVALGSRSGIAAAKWPWKYLRSDSVEDVPRLPSVEVLHALLKRHPNS